MSELVKFRNNRALAPALYRWRDSNGNEIDLLVERGAELVPIELKSGQTVAGDWFEPLEKYLAWSQAARGLLVYGGEARQTRRAVTVYGWREIERAAARAFGI